MAKISKELQDTVKKNPNIKEVYFSAEGDHYFHKHVDVEVHSHDADMKWTKSEKKESLPGGVEYSILRVKVGKSERDKKLITSVMPVGETMTREDVLSAVPSLPGLSPEEKQKILSQAAAIYEEQRASEIISAGQKRAKKD